MAKGSDALLPHDIEAEEAVLGSLLIDPDALALVAPILKAGDFYRERNGWIYSACGEVDKAGGAINQITVSARLDVNGKLQDVGGPAYLSYLVSRCATPFHAEHYAGIVADRAIHRRLIEVGGVIAGYGYQAGLLASEALAKAKEALDTLLQKTDIRGPVHISELLTRRIEPVDQVLTGFSQVDHVTRGGFPRSSLSVLAGETTVGKTALALAMAGGAAKREYQVLIVTLEMGEMQLKQRLQYSAAGVDVYNIRGLEDDHKLQEASTRLSNRPLWIYDPKGEGFDQIRATIVAHKLRYGLDLLLYDYIGLEQGVQAQSETLRRAAVVRALRAMAKEIDAAVLAISPLSRPSGMATERKMSRLAWTSELEYHPDMIMLLEPAFDVDEVTKVKREVPGHVDLDVVKQRTGKAGVKVRFKFSKETQRMVQV